MINTCVLEMDDTCNYKSSLKNRLYNTAMLGVQASMYIETCNNLCKSIKTDLKFHRENTERQTEAAFLT